MSTNKRGAGDFLGDVVEDIVGGIGVFFASFAKGRTFAEAAAVFGVGVAAAIVGGTIVGLAWADEQWGLGPWPGRIGLGLAGLAVADLVVSRSKDAGAVSASSTRKARRLLCKSKAPGILTGQRRRRPKVPFESLKTGLLVVGPTGTGKTVGVVEPALEALASAGYGGLFVDCAGGLSLDAYCTAVIDPDSPAGRAWNPLIEGAQGFAEALYHGEDAHEFYALEGRRAIVAVSNAILGATGLPAQPQSILEALSDPSQLKELRDRTGDTIQQARKNPDVQAAGMADALERDGLMPLKRLCDLSDRDRNERLAGAVGKLEQLATGELAMLMAADPGASVKVGSAANPGVRIGIRLTARHGKPGRALLMAALHTYQQAVLASGSRDLSTVLVADEFAPIVTEDFAPFLVECRQHGGGALLSLQSLGQLDAVGPGYSDIFLDNCRSKICVCPLGGEDALRFERHFGTKLTQKERVSETSDGKPFGRAASVTRTVLDEVEPLVPARDFMKEGGYAIVRLTVGRNTFHPIEVQL